MSRDGGRGESEKWLGPGTMAEFNAAQLAQLLIQLRLLTDEHLLEFRNEDGELDMSAEDLLRTLERKGLLTPWQTHKILRGDTDGFYHGNYRLLYKVGSGTYGRVFRAEDPHTGAVVAIKVLRNRWNSDAHTIELFEREAKVGLTLQHPNIVTILNLGKDQKTDQYYFVMEFVEGGNLRDFLAIRKKLSAADALRILEDAANGLAYASSRGVTHRDMKLSNILISTQGVAKLVDFGLAGKATSIGSGDDIQDRSVDYAGLEMATNVPAGDVRSDIYFMGCVFYEMLTGRSPLTMSRDKHVRMQRERFERVPPITRQEVDAPHSVFQLLETMMSLNAKRRYQNPTQLLGAIRSARHEVEHRHINHAVSGGGSAPGNEPTVFVIEKSERLQDVFRDRLKKHGYRVLLSINPANALNRFRTMPYEAILLNAETTGEEGLSYFQQIMSEAERQKLDFAGILLLAEEQKSWAAKVRAYPKLAVMVRPVTAKQLMEKLHELVPVEGS